MAGLGALFLPFWFFSILCICGLWGMKVRKINSEIILTKKELNLSIILAIFFMIIFYFYNKPEYQVQRAYKCLYNNSEVYRQIYIEGIDTQLKRFKPSFDDL